MMVEPVESKNSRCGKVCERFMKRGNEPVNSNYDEQDFKPIKANDLIIIPNTGGGGGTSPSAKKEVAPIPTSRVPDFEQEVSGINLSKLFSIYGPR
jgi:N-methylhydantoinase B/oxoprolinase/acetone carboxylase alpha subunit